LQGESDRESIGDRQREGEDSVSTLPTDLGPVPAAGDNILEGQRCSSTHLLTHTVIVAVSSMYSLCHSLTDRESYQSARLLYRQPT
jgi:hypothetical protein